MKTKIHYLCLLLSISFTASSQYDIALFNSTRSLTYLNPSFAGSNGFLRLQSSCRVEGYKDAPFYNVSSFAGVDSYIKRLNAGVAVSVVSTSDIDGLYKSTQVNAMYAQHLSLMDHKLKLIPSFEVTYGQKTVDLSRITFAYVAAGIVPWGYYEPADHRNYFSGSAGLLVNYKRFYGGLAVFNINQPDEGLFGPSRLPAKFNVHASYNLPVSERTLINFSASYAAQSAYDYLRLGVNAVFFKHLLAGFGYTPSAYHSFFGCLGYRNNLMSVSVSYDSPLILRNGVLFGGYGLNLSLNLRNKEQRKQLTDFETW